MWRRDRRRAEYVQCCGVHEVGIDIVSGGGAWRGYMIKNPSPFVKIYDEHRVRPFRSSCHGLESFVKEEISFADIGVRMIVIARTVIQNGVPRVNERHRWQCSSAGCEEKLFVETRDTEIFHAP